MRHIKIDNPSTCNKTSINKERRSLLKGTSAALAAGFTGLSPLAAAISPGDNKIIAFGESITGTVVPRGDSNYEPWRQSMSWNYRKFGRYPDLIVQAHNDDDVVATINFAREHGLKIKTRSGGHSWSGCYMRDSGILLDLSRFQSIEVDPESKTAIVGAGVIGRGLNEHLEEHDLVFPTAHCGMVPLSGFMMGGGIGVNFTAWGGMSAFSILGMDVVTADGELKHVSATENPELFWAARGAGPGLFFTVVRFHVQCYPLPHFIRTDVYVLPYEEMLATTEMMEEVGPKIGKGIEMLTVVMPNPADGDVTVPREKGNFNHVTVLSISAFAYSQEEADEKLDPVRNHPQVEKAMFKQLDRHSTMEQLYQDNEVPFPQRRARADNIFTNDASGAISVLREHMPKAPSPGNSPVILYMGDMDMHPETSCYSGKGNFYLAGYAQWDKAENDIANQTWLKNLFDEMKPFASGHYINEYDRETRSAETSHCFKEEDWERIKELRLKYDPSGVYHGFLEV